MRLPDVAAKAVVFIVKICVEQVQQILALRLKQPLPDGGIGEECPRFFEGLQVLVKILQECIRVAFNQRFDVAHNNDVVVRDPNIAKMCIDVGHDDCASATLLLRIDS